MRLVTLLTVFIAAATLAAGPSAATRARLKVVDFEPLAVRGTGFARAERVRVVAKYGAKTAARTVSASATGVLTVRFPGFAVRDPCLLELSARGAKGSRTMLEFSERVCLVVE